MKKKKNHTQDNHEQAILWLTQTIERELARGEEADEQLLLECTVYLQELSPETAVSAKTTEKYLQAEWNRAESKGHLQYCRPHRKALKFSLRLAVVIAALACFCVAIPAVAAHVFHENDVAIETTNFLKPVVEVLTHISNSESIDYPNADDYQKNAGYHRTYTTTKDMLIKESPADVLCLDHLPESLGEYDIQVVHYGKTTSERWKINWSSKDNRWGYLITYYDTSLLLVKLNRPDYERSHERHSVNGRTYLYKVQPDGSYRAIYIQGRVLYSILAPDFETMTLLINHAVPASEIIPAATQTLTLASPTQYSPFERHLNSTPSAYSNDDYLAYYETTDDFLKNERVDILTVNDRISDRLDCSIKVEAHVATTTTSSLWKISWYDEQNQWMFSASYHPDQNMEANTKAYEHLSQYYEKYTVGERTFYITQVTPSEKIIVLDNYALIASYFEGNMWYYINATDRETLEYVINNRVKASELAAQ